MNTNRPPQPAIPNKVTLPEHRDAYYGGKWHAPKDGRYVDTISPGTGESLGKVADAACADMEAAIAAAKAAFKEWRRVPPLERASILKRVAQILRENAGELAMIDAADCGNPVGEMVADATIAAAQMEFFAGLVTEMKGASIPMGPDVVNFSVREPRGVVGRIIPFNHPVHVLRRQIRRCARRRQHHRREAAGAGAAVVAASCRIVRRAVPARRVQCRAWRQGGGRTAVRLIPTSPWWH